MKFILISNSLIPHCSWFCHTILQYVHVYIYVTIVVIGINNLIIFLLIANTIQLYSLIYDKVYQKIHTSNTKLLSSSYLLIGKKQYIFI